MFEAEGGQEFDSELQQHHYFEICSLRLSEVLSIWEPSRRGLQRCHFLDSPKFSVTSMKFMLVSRPSLVCGLFFKSSQLWNTVCNLMRRHLRLEYYAAAAAAANSESIFPNFKCLWGPPRLVRSSSPSGYILPRSPPVAYWVGFFIFFQSVFWETP